MFFTTNDVKQSTEVERMSRGEGRYVMVRIRTKEDLNEFSDLLGEPHLRAMKKNSIVKLKWSANQIKNNPLSEFM